MRFRPEPTAETRHPLEYVPTPQAVALIEAADIDSTVKALLVALLKRRG